MDHDISADLTPEAIEQVRVHLRAIEILLPFLIALTNDERRQLPKAGDAGISFIEHCYAAIETYQGMMPRDFDLDEYKRDVALRAALAVIAVEIARLHTRVQDTLMLVGSEAYAGSLEVYAASQRAGKGQGLDHLLGLARRRFARRPKRNGDETPENGGNGTPTP
ncbi:hypothetical protein EV699_1432 [Plasticicumulans lactativorans]|uniref:Uncharacterized protein n=1 Tax=Plasticicumulans lactativorans TaxID=1133106 RepID=A0A4R2KZ66_9GAMM|nr:hypothetical protein [Plasticicumulans lactativorans]TCO75578.1 hypothetical protein EV699_1432 [Plasticicumulans lactativorans]